MVTAIDNAKLNILIRNIIVLLKERRRQGLHLKDDYEGHFTVMLYPYDLKRIFNRERLRSGLFYNIYVHILSKCPEWKVTTVGDSIKITIEEPDISIPDTVGYRNVEDISTSIKSIDKIYEFKDIA